MQLTNNIVLINLWNIPVKIVKYTWFLKIPSSLIVIIAY